MAYELNVDKYSFASKPEKKADDYTLTIARKLVSSEAETRERNDSALSRRIDNNDDAIESLNRLSLDAIEELKKRELISNKTEIISKAPSHTKYPSEQAVAEYVAGLGEENGGHVHTNKTTLDGLTNEQVDRWEAAADNIGDVAIMALVSTVNYLLDDASQTKSELEDMNSKLVPSSVICMWSGALIPQGWALCDGANGTPDLRDRFVIGSGGSYDTGEIGGSNSIDTSHVHTFSGSTAMARASYVSVNNGSEASASRWDHAHSYNGTTDISGTENSILPPYYALAYIMKL